MSVFFINPFLGAVGGDFESIATVTVGSGGASSIEFTSIPGTYQHLQIRLIGRGNAGATSATLNCKLNGATTDYSRHRLSGNGSSASADGFASQAAIESIAAFADSGATANVFGVAVLDLLDYASTSKNKTLRVFGGFDNNGSGNVRVASGGWFSTNAVTSIQVYLTGTDFLQHSTAALYGIKAP